MIQMVLDSGFHHNSLKATLEFAIRSNDQVVIRGILSAYRVFDIYERISTEMFSYALDLRKPDILKTLSELDVGVYARNREMIQKKVWRLLSEAVTSHSLDILKVLFKCGLDVNLVNKKGRGMFHLAALNRQVELLRLLLEIENLDINLKDPIHGRTVLSHMLCRHYYISEISARMLQMILERMILTSTLGTMMVKLRLSIQWRVV